MQYMFVCLFVDNMMTLSLILHALFNTLIVNVSESVGPPYCRAELYAGRVACCLLVSRGEYADGTDRLTDRRTDAIPLRYAFLL